MRHHVGLLTSCILPLLLAGCGSGGSTTGSQGPQPPVLSSITPTSATLGFASFSLEASGSNFAASSEIEWNGAPLTTVFVSSTELTAQVAASPTMVAGNVSISVNTPGVGSSGTVTLVLSNHAPGITAISPTTAAMNSGTFLLTVTGSNLVSTSQILWNGTTLATTFVSSSQITAQVPASDLNAVSSALVSILSPAPGGGQSASLIFYVTSGTTRLMTIAANANHILWDSTRSRLYASLPTANNGSNGDTIAVIDPVAASITKVQAAGDEPDVIALSSDATRLWVAEDGTSAVQRFALPNFSSDLSIPLPKDPNLGAETAVAMEAAPNSSNTAAMVLGRYDVSPVGFGGLFVYDGSTPRPGNLTRSDGDFDWLQWGPDATVLYGGNNLIPNTFYDMSVDANGITANKGIEYVVGGNGYFDEQTGYIYGDNGQVVNPATGEAVGNFSLSDYPDVTSCAVDSQQGLVFFIGRIYPPVGNASPDAENYVIQVYDKKTYRLLRSLSVPQVLGTVINLVRWGNSGLAFNEVPLSYSTYTPIPGTIYLVDGSFVNNSASPDFTSGLGVDALPVLTAISPQSVVAGSADMTLTVTGKNFEEGSVVFWDKIPLDTAYLNPTEIQATIPASRLATAGTHTISASNGSDATHTLNNQDFSVLSAQNSGLIVDNLAALDVAWDKKSGLLYVPIWSDDTLNPNSIAAIDPASGQVVKSADAGPDPYLIRTSADGALAYTASLSSDTVTQFRLPGLDSPLTWQLGVSDLPEEKLFNVSYFAADVQPAPGASQTTAIAIGNNQLNRFWLLAYANTGNNITIFDNNLSRPNEAANAQGICADDYGSLQWGSDDNTLYATTNSCLDTLAVNSSGVSDVNGFLIYVSDEFRNHFDPGTGYLYNDYGQVTDPAAGKVIGSYGSSGFLVPDSSLNRVFILGQTKAQVGTPDYTITSFNQKTFAPVSSFTISNVINRPMTFIRWGQSGFAFETYSSYYDSISSPPGMLYILTAPSFVAAGQAGLTPDVPPVPVERTWKKPPLPIDRKLSFGRKGRTASR